MNTACICFFLVSFLGSSLAFGAEIEWFRPELKPSPYPGIYRVSLKGWTHPKSAIRIQKERGVVIRQDRPISNLSLPAPLNRFWMSLGNNPAGAKLQPKEKALLMKNVFKRVEKDGFFTLSLHLPEGLTQIPFQFYRSKSKFDSHVLLFTVTAKGVTVNVPSSPLRPRDQKPEFLIRRQKIEQALAPVKARHGVSLGVGGSYQTYSQGSPGGGEVEFSNFISPGFSLSYGVKWSSWALGLNYRASPGEVGKASDPFSVDSGAYQGSEIQVHVSYAPTSLWGWRWGYSHRRMPFADVDTGNEIEIRVLSVGQVDLGVYLNPVFFGLKWGAGLFYGLPISSEVGGDSDFTLSSPLFLQVPLWMDYPLNDHWALGISADSTWGAYSFKYQNKAENFQFSGETEHLTSDFLLKIKYDF